MLPDVFFDETLHDCELGFRVVSPALVVFQHEDENGNVAECEPQKDPCKWPVFDLIPECF